MITLPLVAGLLVVAAAGVAVIVRDGRAVAVAVFVALLLSPFAATAIPGTLQLAARGVAALMAAYVLWVVMKGGAVRSEGSAIGPIAELAVAAGVYAVGWWIQPVGPLQGPLSEQASGFALVALAVLPLAGSNVLRAGVGVLLILLGVSLVMDAWLGPMPALGQLGLTALLLAIPGAMSMLVDPDDDAEKVTPAVDQVRPERTGQPVPADPLVQPFVPRPRPAAEMYDDDFEADSEDDDEAEAEADVDLEPEVAPRPVIEPAPLPKPKRVPAPKRATPPPASAPAPAPARASASEVDAGPTNKVTGPRPSVRFLGRNAPIRHPSEASQARRPGERKLPGLGRHTGPNADAASGTTPPGTRQDAPDASDTDAGSPARQDNRNLRDPRFKRPLR